LEYGALDYGEEIHLQPKLLKLLEVIMKDKIDEHVQEMGLEVGEIGFCKRLWVI
jgi:hypothetical protein